jgi:hypothetical protein
MKTARTVLPSVPSLAVPYFSTLSYTRYDFRKKIIEHKMRVSILSTTPVRKILILRRTGRDVIINVHIGVKCVSHFNETLIFSTDFRKIIKYQISLKPSSENRIGPCGQTDGRTETDRQT